MLFFIGDVHINTVLLGGLVTLGAGALVGVRKPVGQRRTGETA